MMKHLRWILWLVMFSSPVLAAEMPVAHDELTIEGWRVRLDKRLTESRHAELGQKAVALLRARLADIVTVLPSDKTARLQQVPIQMDLEHGDLGSMQYHPSAAWLEKNGYSKDLAKTVHIPVAARFLAARHQQVQPWCVLHELAHAYHDQVLGFENPQVAGCWQRYVDSKHGEKALHVDGRTVRHYALTNPKEFFAEMTEAYFGTNDFTPFVHGQLKQDEPETFALLQEIWGKSPLDK